MHPGEIIFQVKAKSKRFELDKVHLSPAKWRFMLTEVIPQIWGTVSEQVMDPLHPSGVLSRVRLEVGTVETKPGSIPFLKTLAGFYWFWF